MMMLSRILTAAALLGSLVAASAQDDLDRALLRKDAEQKVINAIRSPDLTVVHLWAPWCSNCQTELKSGGWSKMVKENPQVNFYFVSIWNDGADGASMLKRFQIGGQPNVTIL